MKAAIGIDYSYKRNAATDFMRLNGSDKKYYHFDELGNTLFLTDANGVQTDKYVYNAWGKVVSSSGTTANPFKYVGRLGYYQDAGTGLYWVGTRFYDPDAGVFTQRDMAKDGLSWYSYTSGHSMVAVDPWGEAELVDVFYKNWRSYSHTFISFKYLTFPQFQTNLHDTKLHHTVGIYYNLNVQIPDNYETHYDTRDDPDYLFYVRRINNDRLFEEFLYSCIKMNYGRKYSFIFPTLVCTNYANLMWDCAGRKMYVFRQCMEKSILTGKSEQECKKESLEMDGAQRIK